ncbi:MAG: sporulation protein YabP [Eubacteriales bacterium]|nr:sporulation protein YabP [Eubacteriales bacterium]
MSGERKEEPKRIGSAKGHSIYMESRENGIVNGVEAVLSFDEESVVMLTAYGMLTVSGSELHIVKLDLESGQVVVQGEIEGAEYSEGHASRSRGLLSRMLR